MILMSLLVPYGRLYFQSFFDYFQSFQVENSLPIGEHLVVFIVQQCGRWFHPT
jgi:hypothetical protein